MALGTLDIIGLADTAYGLIEDLVDHGSTEDFWGSFTDSNEAIISKLDGISAKLDEAVAELRSAIGYEIEDVQQQNLLSALARAENARDLLSSAGSSDAVDPGTIISDASHAFRDVLAQAKAITDPAYGTVQAGSVILSSFAVSYALSSRLAVAATYEADELSSNKITRQIDDAADFFENLPGVVTNLAKASISVDITKHTETVEVPMGVDVNTGTSITREWHYSYYTLEASAEFGGESFEYKASSYDKSVVDSTSEDIAGRYAYNYIGDGYKTVSKTSSGLAISNDLLPEAFDFAGRPDFSNRYVYVNFESDDGKALATTFYEKLLISAALEQAGLGADGSAMRDLADTYRTLTDGKELVAFEAPGVSNDAELIGTDGNDLLVGKGGNDTIWGKGDSDLIRGGGGNDLLIGGDGEDRLIGGPGDDSLEGRAGDDALEPGPGSDRVVGGAGFDVVRMEGNRADFDLTYTHTVRPHVSADDGHEVNMQFTGPTGEVDRLSYVERVFFDDATVNILYGTSGADGAGRDTIEGDFELVVRVDEDGTKHYSKFASDDLIFAGDETGSKGSAAGDVIHAGGGDDIVHAGAGNDLVEAGTGNDLVYGGAGADRLYGGVGKDTLFGGDGNDALYSGAGDDVFDGGAGVDYVHYQASDGSYLPLSDARFAYSFAERAFLVDMPDGTDTLRDIDRIRFAEQTGIVVVDEDGSFPKIDVSPFSFGLVYAGDGDDTVIGTSGNDLLVGGAGDDEIDGGDGDGDIAAFSGLSTAYTITSEDGESVIVEGPDGRDVLRGIEVLQFDDKTVPLNVIAGTPDRDTLTGTGDDDILVGLGGNDRLIGRNGNDMLFGGAGDDIVYGGAGADVMVDGAGSDFYDGGTPDDRVVFSGLRADFTFLEPDADYHGNRGHRVSHHGQIDELVEVGWLVFDDAEMRVHFDRSDVDAATGDRNAEVFFGYDGADTLTGRGGDDVLFGDDGDDRILAGRGNDTAHGGLGDDTVRMNSGNDLATGGRGNDTLIGGGGNDTLLGGAQDDLLAGGKGKDMLTGGAGDDVLRGGAGKDTFFFDGALDEGSDRIRDFDAAADTIAISGVSAPDVTLDVTTSGRTSLDLGHGTTIDLGLLDPAAFTADDILFV